MSWEETVIWMITSWPWNILLTVGTRCKQEAPSNKAQVRLFPPKRWTFCVCCMFENKWNDVYAELLIFAVSSRICKTTDSTNVEVFESFHGWVIEVECRDYTECNHSSNHRLSEHRLEQTLPEDDCNAADVLLTLYWMLNNRKQICWKTAIILCMN